MYTTLKKLSDKLVSEIIEMALTNQVNSRTKMYYPIHRVDIRRFTDYQIKILLNPNKLVSYKIVL
jgi:hypothetical protein